MWMMLEVLSPGVQDTEKIYVSTKVLGIAGDLDQLGVTEQHLDGA